MLDVGCSPFSRHPSRVTRHSRGVALIITLILLAVVTFMALTFLAVSRRERNAVTTTTDTASAQLAADDALAAAEGQIVANTLATTNPYNFGLLVSTNYINPYGFVTGTANFTNVNYYYPNGNPLNPNDFLQLMGNLFYLPRAPVYMSNFVTRTMENRFYLDLNRNGVDDPNGWWPEIGNNGLPIVNGGVTNYVYETGDPEWVGVLQHPDQPYGPNNLFVARYAFIAVPIGNALDLNAIHNQVLDESQPGFGNRGVQVNPPPGGVGNDTFLRNQGVGSWEINLAAFLADVNTNQWGQIVGSGAFPPPGSAIWYQYNEANPKPSVNSGHAFDDARALLAYRYGNNYLSLNPASRLFSNFGLLRFDNIDEYSDGPLQTTPAPINEAGLLANRDNPTLPWAGAANTNRFFSVDDLFDSGKEFNQEGISAAQIAAGNDFAGRLRASGTNYSTYNRYTYYRLVSQMGVDSTPEQGKLNVNYRNVDANGNVVPGLQTNLIPWTALQFFTNAADRMLGDYSQEWMVASPSNYVLTYGSFTNIGTFANPTNLPLPMGISRIPVLVNNQFVYTPAVQRVLQLAANIYDATTNNTFALGADFPSVFRPIFEHDNFGNVFIVGYTNLSSQFGLNTVAGPGDPQLALPYDVTSITNLSPDFTPIRDANGYLVNVYGVPWIIGAKKGFPNFNEFAMESTFQLTRKLQVTRPSTNSPISAYLYNQQYNLSLTNSLGVECWNSYTNNYTRSVAMYVTCTNTCLLTNDEGFNTNLAFLISGYLPIDSTSNNNNGWPGYNPQSSGTAVFLTPASFQIPLNTNVAVIPTSMYRFNVGGNVEEPGHFGPYLTTNFDYPWGNSLFESGVAWNGRLYPQPHWLLMRRNDVRLIMLDTQSGPPYHIIDYVQLSGPNTNIDLTSQIIANFDTATGPSGSDLWNTNIQNNLPIGLISQIGVSLGNYPPGVGYGVWAAQSDIQRENEIDGFRAFFNYSLLHPNNPGESEAVAEARMTNNIQVPYTPTAALAQEVDWQVNDPLVHYTADDLQGAPRNGRVAAILPNQPSDWPINLGVLNDRYSPWGGHQPVNTNAPDPNAINAYNLALKDPLVWRSDDWDFPTYKFPSVGWLGRVHRGTPWQTVYLKSPDILQQTSPAKVVIGTNSWAQWTGDTQLTYGQNYDAVNTAPVQDRLLFDVFTTALNDNATRGQLSVNVGASDTNNVQAGLAAWSALFSGVIVLSNNAVDAAVNPAVVAAQHNGSLQNFTAFPINPAGPAGANSAVGRIVAGINQTRTNFVNPDGLAGSFERAGDILAVPQLTWQSPFLNWNDAAQQVNGISDEMYEWLPQQVMSLVHVADTPRFVIYSYGQALKPAPNGINTANITLANGQSAFGMVTNYQVVAEAATRAVVRFDGTRVDNIVLTNDGSGINRWMVAPFVNNTHAVIEQFNVLPAQ